jgi:D-amino-acid dehydrogenase
LHKDGHEVVVLERHDKAAAETSFGNAGLIAPGHAYSWASPAAPKILAKSLFKKNQALRFKPRLELDLYRWSIKFLRNCTSERAAHSTRNKSRLSVYSRDRLHVITEDTGVDYDGIRRGLLYCYRDEPSFQAGVAKMKILSEGGQRLEPVDPARIVEIEPALAGSSKELAGAIYCPDDESGDSHLFSNNLASWLVQRGVDFRYSTEVKGFERSGDRLEAVGTSGGRVQADAFVLSVGAAAARLGRKLSLDLPVYPIKGYSVTMPIGAGHKPPSVGGVDEKNLVAWARFGDRMRLTSTAEFAGYDTSHRPSDFEAMLMSARNLFPNGADWSQPFYWAGLRPMTPEGSPILGTSPIANLWLNAGHGHMGWTMAAGSARIVADMISGKEPEIDTTGLTLTSR